MTAGSAAAVVIRTLDAPPTLGAGRLVCIDGPAGSGKTTLATEVVAAVPPEKSWRLLHMDDVFRGWSGLAEGVDVVTRDVVAPLARGLAGGFRRYDWHAEGLAEWVEVEPVDLLVVEGVGSGATGVGHVTTLVWVEADEAVRLARWVARDGADARLHSKAWMRDEAAHFARNRTRVGAHLVLDTSR